MRQFASMVSAAMLLAVAPPLAGFAGTWSGSKTLADGDVVTDAFALDGAVTVEVASGTATISGVVSGGRLVKTGAGELKLSGANSMEGVTVSAGAVTVANNAALGLGRAIVLGQREGYEGKCELRFNSGSTTGSLAIENDIEVAGNTTVKYPAFVFYYKGTTLNGAISAVEDLIFLEDYTSTKEVSSSEWNRNQKVLAATFVNTITVGGTFGSAGWVRYQFKEKITANEISLAIARTDNSYANNQNAHCTFDILKPCDVKKVTNGFATYFYMGCENAFSGAVFSGVTGGGKTEPTPMFYAKSYAGTTYAQSVSGFESPVWEDSFKKPLLTYDSAKALTVTGVEPLADEESPELSSSIVLSGSMSLTLDAPSAFTQTLVNKKHTMTGSLTVKCGTMKLTGTARFPSVSALTIENGGVFDASSTTAEDFLPTNGTLALSLKTGAVLKIPNGCTEWKIKSLRLDGFLVPAGSRASHATHAAIPEGVTLVALEGGEPPAATSSATWTGAGDKIMTTMANWEGTPESLDLATGALAVTLGAGGSVIYPNGVRINSISADGLSTATPVVLKPQGEDDVLTIDRNVTGFVQTAQLFLSGHIATPYHISQGSAEKTGSCVLRYDAKQYADGATLPEGDVFLIQGSSNRKSLPLVLDGVKLEKPLCVTTGYLGTYALYARDNTTNVLSGHVNLPSPWAYIGAAAGAVIEYANGVNSGWAHHFTGSGTHIFRNKPVVCSSLCTFEGNTTVIFDTEGCSTSGSSTGEGMRFDACKVEFLRSGTFTDNATLVIGNSGVVTWDCNVTTQRFGIAHFANAETGSELRGDYPARLEVTGKIRAGASVTPTQTVNIPVAGGLGFCACGDAAALVLQARDYGSCGDLEASAGSLELASGATWLNGTNFIARGTGTLKFASRRQIDRTKARLVVADDGRVDIADGSTLAVAEATLDGQPVAKGVYRVGDGSALGTHLAQGAVRVGEQGLILIFK